MRVNNNEEKLERDDNFYKVSRFDFLLIGVILLFSVISIFWFMRGRFGQSSGPKTALVYQQNQLLKKINLDKDGILTFLNGQMQVEIKGKRIRMIKAECPQHVCINMGWIKYGGQAIVCTPNKVVIEIASSGSPFLDAVVY